MKLEVKSKKKVLKNFWNYKRVKKISLISLIFEQVKENIIKRILSGKKAAKN